MLSIAVLKGVLKPMLSATQVNSVNAPYLAKERGLTVQESKINSHSDYTVFVEVVLQFPKMTTTISGTVFGKRLPKIVRFDNAEIELTPEGVILVVQNKDKPGVVGKIGTFLGQNKVNINHIQLGLDQEKELATAFYNLDKDVDQNLIEGLRKIEGIVSVKKVIL